MKRIGIMIVSALAMLSIASVGSASAATEVGNDCTANGGVPATLLQLSKSGDSPPLTAPAAGVVTKWKVNVQEGFPPISLRMRAFRDAGGDSFNTIGESEMETVTPGADAFETRMPVQAGDRFGSYGASPAALYCNTGNPNDKMGYYEGNAGPGSTQSYKEATSLQVAMSVTVEPDVDNDGYGDETQDLCPQSAAIQTSCPIITLGSYGIARRNAAIILATSSYPTPVAVAATVNVPRQLLRNKRGKRKGKSGARSSALIRIDGGTKAISPGGLGFYTLKFPQALRKALRNLPRKRKLTLVATTSATDVAGRPSSTVTRVKLRGQKPNKKKRAKGKRKAKGKR